jgi:hypothetical protein
MRIVGLFVALALAAGTDAFAGQSWEVEAHGGVLTSSNPSSGTASLPPIGPDIPLGGPGSITRRVPSWYFGDGAAILNQIIGLRSSSRIVPLDPVLGSPLVERGSAGSFGFRVARTLSSRFGLELAFDSAEDPLTLRSASKQLVSSSAASFTPVWNALLTAPSAAAQVVTSAATFDDKRGRQLITTGSLLVNLLSSSTFVPYLAVGAGSIVAHGGAPSVTLVGNYSFVFPSFIVSPGIPQGHFDETDRVTIQAVTGSSLTWVVGGGVKYALGDRWGVRADLRDYVNRDALRTVVTTAPSSMPSASSGTLIFSFSQTAPFIVFSSSPLSLSTLSAPLTDVQTFKGHGIVNHVNAAAGIYWRF